MLYIECFLRLLGFWRRFISVFSKVIGVWVTLYIECFIRL